MARGAPALMIGVGEADPAEGDAEPMADSSSGVLATTAFCKAKDRGDYEAAYEAFKDMLAAADDDLAMSESEEPMPA